MSSLDRFYLLVGVVPFYPPCCLLTTVAPPLALPIGTTHSGYVVLSTRICFIFRPPNHDQLSCFVEPPVPFERGLGCNGPPRGLNFNTHKQCSLYHSVARNTPRSSTRDLCQVVRCPRSPWPTLPVIVASITTMAPSVSYTHLTLPTKA